MQSSPRQWVRHLQGMWQTTILTKCASFAMQMHPHISIRQAAISTWTVITLGESEVESGQVNVKNNATREEVTVSFEELTKNFAVVLEQLEK